MSDVEALEAFVKGGAVRRVGWRTQLRRTLGFIRPDRGLAGVALSLILVGAVLSAVEPLAFMYLFDALAGGDVERALVWGTLAFLGIGLARELVGGVANWLVWKVRLRVNYRLLEATVDRTGSPSRSTASRAWAAS